MVTAVGVGCTARIQWVEVRDAVNILQGTGPPPIPTKNYPAPRVSGAQVEKPCPKQGERKAEVGKEARAAWDSLLCHQHSVSYNDCNTLILNPALLLTYWKSLNLIQSLYLTLSRLPHLHIGDDDN